jgi:steroid delta-isomerase-like uncharacterized protein
MSELDPAIAAYFDALNNLDRAAYVASFSPDAMLRDPYGGPVLEGEGGLNKFFDGVERTWSEFKMEPEAAYKSGDRVAVPWHTTATNKAGKTADFAGVNVFGLDDDGRIKQLDGYWDFKAMMAQLQ